jgi:hypothetical protein
MGRGDGTLEPAVHFGSPGAQVMTVLDVNGDKRPDLVVANESQHNVSVLLQKPNDTTPPTLSVSLSPAFLWPPNHDLRSIHATVTALDNSGQPPSVSLVSIASDQPDQANSGHKSMDIQDAAFGAADFDFRLRAERSGESARRYTVCYEARDGSGNVTRQCDTVEVAHDRRGRAAVNTTTNLLEPAPSVLEAALPSNPIVEGAWIRYGLPRAGHVRFEIIDVAGHRVAMLVDGWRPAGWGQVPLAGPHTPGIYFYRLESEGQRRAGKFTFLH